MFQNFLNAGAARVVIPVPLAWDAVKFLLVNPRNETDLSAKFWNAGKLPGLDDPLWRSIAEELRDKTDDLEGAKPEGTSWEITVPTTLVWLQPSDRLPTDFEKKK